MHYIKKNIFFLSIIVTDFVKLIYVKTITIGYHTFEKYIFMSLSMMCTKIPGMKSKRSLVTLWVANAQYGARLAYDKS